MSQNFTVSYVAGGRLDDLPHPLFPRKHIPHIIGRSISVSSTPGSVTDSFTTATDSEYLCISVACSVYTIGDYWSLSIDGKVVCDTIYLKGLPESISVGNTMVVVYPIPSGTEFIFTFNNSHNVEKQVFYNLHFLE